MLGYTPYSKDEEKVVMRSAEELDEYYDCIDQQQEDFDND